MSAEIDIKELSDNIAVIKGVESATDAQKTKLLQRSMINIESVVKKWARSGGAFSSKSKGMLARKIGWKVESNGVGVITSGVVYGLIQEFGGTTKPHPIVAKFSPYRTEFSWRKGNIVGKRERGKTGGVLAFVWKGKQVFLKSVNHPGSKIPATNYTKHSFEVCMPDIEKDAQALMQSVVTGSKWP